MKNTCGFRIKWCKDNEVTIFCFFKFGCFTIIIFWIVLNQEFFIPNALDWKLNTYVNDQWWTGEWCLNRICIEDMSILEIPCNWKPLKNYQNTWNFKKYHHFIFLFLSGHIHFSRKYNSYLENIKLQDFYNQITK